MATARELARACDQYVSALWRGETVEVHRFGRWLRSHWDVVGPEEPEEPPHAISSASAGGAGIHWYDNGTMIYGYIPGVNHHCYQVPKDAEPPTIGLSPSRTPVPA